MIPITSKQLRENINQHNTTTVDEFVKHVYTSAIETSKVGGHFIKTRIPIEYDIFSKEIVEKLKSVFLDSYVHCYNSTEPESTSIMTYKYIIVNWGC
jgi:hypothetical protein